MKRSILAIVLALATLIAGSAVASAGNGAPRGPHDYQLNIIGTSEKNADMDGNNGHRIFVNLSGKTAIHLEEGPYAVLDANGTDRDGATFQLPAPGYDAYIVGDPGDADVESDYSVFIRPLGKPGGMATITTCAELVDTGFDELLPGSFRRTLNDAGMIEGTRCSIEQVGQDILYREKGKKSSFTNVTAALTSVVFNVEYEDVDGKVLEVQIRVPLFDPIMDGEYWEVDNNGLRLAQVRFYDCSTNVETGASNC